MNRILEILKELHKPTGGKIVLLVADGLGGLPRHPGGRTELETASTPNLDALVRDNVCGLTIPVLPGISPGSGPGHLSLFGYDPLETFIGRGVLEALGMDLELTSEDVAVRGNFCTVNAAGEITDRRAGRIPTETCVRLVEKLRAITVEGVQINVQPSREYRFVVVFTGEDLGGDVEDTDPQMTGVKPVPPVARNPASEGMARVAQSFIAQASEILRDENPANMVMLRGFAKRPAMPMLSEVCGVKAAAIAVYPTYRGLARLAGMTILQTGSTLEQQIESLKANWDTYDFFFIHYKYTDSAAEDGNFDEKVRRIEELDSHVPAILALQPDVLVVTGDHSTPSTLRSHSWHPVPVLLAAKTCRPDSVSSFGETECVRGGLGQIEAKYLLSLAMAHAERLQRYGA